MAKKVRNENSPKYPNRKVLRKESPENLDNRNIQFSTQIMDTDGSWGWNNFEGRDLKGFLQKFSNSKDIRFRD